MWQKDTAVCRWKQTSIVLARTKKTVGLVTQLCGDQFTCNFFLPNGTLKFDCIYPILRWKNE
jgi:hypothetical protein